MCVHAVPRVRKAAGEATAKESYYIAPYQVYNIYASIMSLCGAFYGRLDSLVSTPTSQAVCHSSRSSSTDSSRFTNSPSVTRVTPSSTTMNISRANNRALEHKIDQLLDAIEEQKKENSEILSKLKLLQDAVDCGGEGVTGKVNKKIPYSLSVRGSGVDAIFNVIYRRRLEKSMRRLISNLMVHNCKAYILCVCMPIHYLICVFKCMKVSICFNFRYHAEMNQNANKYLST